MWYDIDNIFPWCAERFSFKKDGRNNHFIETLYVPLGEIEMVFINCKLNKPGLYLQRIWISEKTNLKN